MSTKKKRWWVGVSAAVLAGLTLCACGYQFGGGGTLIPKDASTIYVEPFINRTREIGIEKELTTAVRGEMYRKGQLRLVDQAEQGDVILSGVVRSLHSQVVSINRYDEVLQYESNMVLDVTLRRKENSEILWRGPGIKLSQVYAGSRAAVVTTSSEFRNGTLDTADVRRMTDIQLTESRNVTAREKLMARFAEELYQQIMETF